MIHRKPGYMSLWIWRQYKEFIEDMQDPQWESFDGADVTTQERVRFFNNIALNAESKSLWTAIEDKRDIFDHTLGREEDNPEINYVEVVLEAAYISYWECNDQAVMSRQERMHDAKEISLAAQMLSRKVSKLWQASRPEERNLPTQFPDANYSDLIILLTQIASGAKKWGETAPDVRRGHGTTKQRAFVASIEEYFEFVFDSRMPAVAKSLAHCIYEVPIQRSPTA